MMLTELPSHTPTTTDSPTIEPTNSFSDILTATPAIGDDHTNTPEPLLMDIHGIVLTEETPFPWAPLLFGTAEVTAGPDGSFLAQVPVDHDASVRSGIDALRILHINDREMELLAGTGRDIAAFMEPYGQILKISVSSRIVPGDPCLSYSSDTGEEILRFPYTNRGAQRYEVISPDLNTVWSISGTPAPAPAFEATNEFIPNNYFGFEWPLANFTWLDSNGIEHVSAIWRLLGQQREINLLKSEILPCVIEGTINECAPITAAMAEDVIRHTMDTIFKLSQAALKTRDSTHWKASGKPRIPYLKRAARAIKGMRSIINSMPKKRYICPGQAPATCSSAAFPKAALTEQFDSILKVKLPKGLKKLVKIYPKFRTMFLNELKKQPDTFTYCAD